MAKATFGAFFGGASSVIRRVTEYVRHGFMGVKEEILCTYDAAARVGP